MLRPWEFAIALRYVRSRNKNRFISFISVISMTGIALAVAVLIMVLSVMNGFESEVRNRILQIVAHASITGLDGRIADWQSLAAVAGQDPGVRSVARFVDGQAMLVGPAEIRGVQLRGIDPASELRTSALGSLMVDGTLEALEPGVFGMVIGRTLAEQLGVGVGDSVIVLVSQGITTPAGVVPRMRRFRVTGIFYAGMYEFDRALVFVNVADAQRLFRFGEDVTGIRLAVDDPLQAPTVVRSVANAWGGGVYVTDWTREHGNFFRSIQLTRSIIFVILLLVVGVAAFNIVSTLVMVVRDKRGEIAILRTLGSTPAAILTIFVLQGALVGIVGTAAGVAAGVLGAWNVSAIAVFIERLTGFQFLAPDVYFISELPSRLVWTDVWQVAGIALLLALLSTLYPAWRGAVTAPAEVLRYE
ncbi:MAG: lipoprotein-releasing ABC transporter permease subunit [Chromatiales bacterium]|nr:lipoprotein-releasing ABC transporter permease subunit [Chromatiales bacterium]